MHHGASGDQSVYDLRARGPPYRLRVRGRVVGKHAAGPVHPGAHPYRLRRGATGTSTGRTRPRKNGRGWPDARRSTPKSSCCIRISSSWSGSIPSPTLTARWKAAPGSNWPTRPAPCLWTPRRHGAGNGWPADRLAGISEATSLAISTQGHPWIRVSAAEMRLLAVLG